MTTLQAAIETYIRAKDGNHPHLMARAFSSDTELVMQVKTDEISFPGEASGLAAVSDVLVSQFARRYENVYTFCIGAPPAAKLAFDCAWLVAMTEKDSRLARLGFGRYDWLADQETGLVRHLRITIETMATLPPETAGPILDWCEELPYPWCPRDALVRHAPAIDAVTRVVEALTGLA
jgi:hypothetical protein